MNLEGLIAITTKKSFMNVNICVVQAYFQELRCILRGPIFQENIWRNFHGIRFRLQQGLPEYFTKLLNYLRIKICDFPIGIFICLG